MQHRSSPQRHRDFRRLIRDGDFETLFIRRLGWDYLERREPVLVPESSLRPVAVADKRGVTVWRVDCPHGLPQRSEQHRVLRSLKRLSRDQLIVFTSAEKHVWQWPEQRPSGVGYRLVDHEYPAGAPSPALLQRLEKAAFTIDEELELTSSEVLHRVRRSFNADKVTKSFYREFQKHHKDFAAKIEGIPTDKDSEWYASVLLNRLMFVYFIQQKQFLDGDQNYLRKRLQTVKQHYGENQFYAFYKQFLLPFFHQGLGSPDPVYHDADIKRIIGKVPYINGGIFEPHHLEETCNINIKDEAFKSLFDFFDAWRWHLDETVAADEKTASTEINPDILGFIFEQYINQKEKGAYYTKPDVTGYMAASTILPALVERLTASGLEDPCILLSGSGDAYIHDSILHGVDQPLPDDRQADPQHLSGDVDLPGERRCDTTYRRGRCRRLCGLLEDNAREWTVDDAVTENLDLRELLADYLSLLSTPDECDTAFCALRSLTVCDPTVGSGAFLFAALEVLYPLYEAVLGRAAELHDKNSGNRLADCLKEARKHPSQRYWTLKTLCLNNLYGVDLMAEAPEIAKLRLFLKLAAQIDDVNLVEPLPDLDFNIKSGNLLVGIADGSDARARFGEGKFDYGDQMALIEDLAVEVADAYDAFIQHQSHDTGAAYLKADRNELASKLTAARVEASTLLHAMRIEQRPVDEWVTSHRPFHWFVEFPSVWRQGGFDVVIGNPPYIKTNKVTDYTWQGYKTQKCPDLYAVCVERASALLNNKGRMSMIVMHSLCFSRNFLLLRQYLWQYFSSLWISSYARRPDSLFAGSAAVRNSIICASIRGKKQLHTSNCRRWTPTMRAYMFASVYYSIPTKLLLCCGSNPVWPFVEDQILADVLGRLIESNSTISSAIVKDSEYKLGFKTTALYQLGLYENEPPKLDPHTLRPVTTTSNRSGWFRFRDSVQRDLAFIMLIGRWGYLWWLTFSDEFDVTKTVLASFPGDLQYLAQVAPLSPEGELRSEILKLSQRLKAEMLQHIAWTVKAGVKVGRYNMLKCRHITDEADLLLARLWGVEYAYEAAGNLRDRMVFGNKG